MDLFDFAQASRLRDVGLAKVSGYPNDSWVDLAKDVAENLARQNGTVTINDVLKECPKPESVHPNVIGAVFRDKRFRVIGYTKSDKVSAHARTIGIYTVD